MTIAIALAVLAVFDALLAGFRGAAGRDGLIDKRRYFRAAIVRAGLLALCLVGFNIGVVAVLVASGGSWAAFVHAGVVCVWIFGSFATLTVIAIALWFVRDPDTQLLATVIVLGPFTLVRPFVIAGGLAIAAASSSEPRVWIAACVAAITMLSFERFAGRAYAGRWRALLEPRTE
jgi:hypothetical protein